MAKDVEIETRDGYIQISDWVDSKKIYNELTKTTNAWR
jgi:hypothetical protein